MEKIYTLYHRPAEDNLSGITSKDIDVNNLLNASEDESAGGLVLFAGKVRNNNKNKVVDYIFYESYASMAEKMIKQIVDDAIIQFKLTKALCVHKTGKVPVGEIAVVVITVGVHRKEAYDANQYIIDRVKHEAPIWKQEYYRDGTYEWGNNCSCH